MSKYTFIDLFAGCGGLSEGFLQSGHFEALAHVEWELPMVKTLRKRLVDRWEHSEDDAEKRVIHFDIQKTDELINGDWLSESVNTFGSTNHEQIIESGLRGLIKDQKVDLVIGGPPCQAYSLAGRAQDKNSMKDDYRNYLFESFVKVVEEFQPAMFVFENVQGLLSACPGGEKVTGRIYKAFSEIGYEIKKPEKLKEALYTATDFEVPQKRNRIIIVGVKKQSEFDLKEVYKSIDKLKRTDNHKTVKDAIAHLPSLRPLNKSVKENGRNISHKQSGGEKVKFHESRYHNERDVNIFGRWLKDNMNSRSMQERINFYNVLMNKNSNHAKYRNLEWDKPSPTIVAHLYKDGLMFIHPDVKQARSITIKEAALLQSFPDDYDFCGTNGDCFKMIGNAVPPLMARKIAEAIINYIEFNKTAEYEDTCSV
ncbi:DNA cytosine methyltransferase [Aestuariibaculum marinum]|uniref:Cytosine-specific methyltransferase n=1 Tax=Aestuariibaculum marinum TaxID=2683592 RepID=A0A8J6U4V4_9FLAO|nr:DNA cytosine methyltransferase [Aestuariibaculum marinum]MBD0824440.1 DNA cytosine methyltransferase [Aestuariibaculum marinum]